MDDVKTPGRRGEEFLLQSKPSSQAWGMTILRVAIAIIFIAHASQKLFSHGIDAVAKAFAQLGVPLPTVSTVAISGLEFVGGLLLLIGLLARPHSCPACL
jgi:putative oxidoreductase